MKQLVLLMCASFLSCCIFAQSQPEKTIFSTYTVPLTTDSSELMSVELRMPQKEADDFKSSFLMVAESLENCTKFNGTAKNPSINKSVEFSLGACGQFVMKDFSGRHYRCYLVSADRTQFASNIRTQVANNSIFGDWMQSSLKILQNSCEIE